MSDLQQRIQWLSEQHADQILNGITRGVEKESLRVDSEGLLAKTPHAKALGSALTHPQITTDYSEALLEFITPPTTSVQNIFKVLEDIHSYTYHHIGNELLWVNSMPCMLGLDEDIPIAEYGHSNIGKMKHIYRIGLGHRYGRLMQTISGIHYNFSLPDDFWVLLRDKESPGTELQTFKTERYFGLIRNFRRYFWLLLYLFGAAPAVCKSFVKDRKHKLVPFGSDSHSQHAPLATSLRMGDLGYQSKAQESLIVCYNSLESYTRALHKALTTPYAAYEKIGLKTNGNYQQLNTHLLQIENEFYSTIRPKRTAASGETPLNALWDRGVEYIEVRCIDLNPYDPVGISPEQIYFLDTFLLLCLLEDSPDTNPQEYQHILENQFRTVYQGRDPQLTLLKETKEVSAKDWQNELFSKLQNVAKLLDNHQQTQQHTASLSLYGQSLENPDAVPSAKILQEMASSGESYFQVALKHAKKHREYFLTTPISKEVEDNYREMAINSLDRQRQLEQSQQIDFDAFLKKYYDQYNLLLT